MTRSTRALRGLRRAGTKALMLAVALAACGSQTVPPEDAALERARETANALTVELAGILGEELQRGGPTAAVKVCSEVAQKIAVSHSTAGLEARRVSLRARNPADEPDEVERARLEEWEEVQRSGGTVGEYHEILGEGGVRELRYLRPIFIAGVCLQCHGDPAGFGPELRRLLDEEYPEDRAVGYETGDLRGAVSVRVDLGGK